jgi:hypothetical protein
MKSIARTTLLILCTVFLAIQLDACRKAIRSNSANNNPATLIFGQGGGFTGKYIEFSLVVNGALYKHDPVTGQREFVGKISKKYCREFFLEAERLKLDKMDFNHPHNINYYITYRKGVSENKVNWGNSLKPPPDGVQALWDKLWALTNQ